MAVPSTHQKLCAQWPGKFASQFGSLSSLNMNPMLALHSPLICEVIDLYHGIWVCNTVHFWFIHILWHTPYSLETERSWKFWFRCLSRVSSLALDILQVLFSNAVWALHWHVLDTMELLHVILLICALNWRPSFLLHQPTSPCHTKMSRSDVTRLSQTRAKSAWPVSMVLEILDTRQQNIPWIMLIVFKIPNSS